MSGDVYIAEAARRLGVTPNYLRILERQGRILSARRDFNGRVYSTLDIAALRHLGIGSRPRKLKRLDPVLETA